MQSGLFPAIPCAFGGRVALRPLPCPKEAHFLLAFPTACHLVVSPFHSRHVQVTAGTAGEASLVPAAQQTNQKRHGYCRLRHTIYRGSVILESWLVSPPALAVGSAENEIVVAFPAAVAAAAVRGSGELPTLLPTKVSCTGYRVVGLVELVGGVSAEPGYGDIDPPLALQTLQGMHRRRERHRGRNAEIPMHWKPEGK